MEEIFLSTSADKTQKFAEDFAKKLVGGDVVLLYGNLGAGKTTFVQGLARGLGVESRIISPTFIILRRYGNLHHIDLYRLETEADIAGLGVVELMQDKDNIVVIEWPERLGSAKPEKRWEVHFEATGDEERKIAIKKYA